MKKNNLKINKRKKGENYIIHLTIILYDTKDDNCALE